MSLRENLVDYSRGDDLRIFWRIFRMRDRTENRFLRNILTFICSRMAAKHGGYVGYGAQIKGIPSMPHGLHGVYISRYAYIGEECRIYQNVTIGETDHKAPCIGDHCLIGAGAVIIGDITIGDHVKIGAGAVVCRDVPEGCTVVSQPARILYPSVGESVEEPVKESGSMGKHLESMERDCMEDPRAAGECLPEEAE